MPAKSDETFTREEIQERFQRLFKRPMTPKERACFFLLPETEEEGRAARVTIPIKED